MIYHSIIIDEPQILTSFRIGLLDNARIRSQEHLASALASAVKA